MKLYWFGAAMGLTSHSAMAHEEFRYSVFLDWLHWFLHPEHALVLVPLLVWACIKLIRRNVKTKRS
ncbi:hypothetical protein [Alteromonas facilis]|uniref:hypothetical protein n=1 Tax=Alteromonas facilis TaxID=2048004 RepID=UPI000C28738B|nr:hypothetical protein [Alteromonas facilis]